MTRRFYSILINDFKKLITSKRSKFLMNIQNIFCQKIKFLKNP